LNIHVGHYNIPKKMLKRSSQRKESNMKKGTFALIVIVALWLVPLGSPCWGAPQYLGQSTWTISITLREHGSVSESASMTGAITRMGGAYYSFQGYVDVQDDGPFILAGGGVLIGDILYLNLTGTQKHTGNDWRDTEILHAQLDKTTLTGTFYSVGQDFDASTAGTTQNFDTRFQAGTLTRTGAPIVLTQGLASPMSLLLLE
jgi:hypothetical protein